MDTKLTLKRNQDIIDKAKKYACDRKMAFSRIVEFYLPSFTIDHKKDEFEISSFIKRNKFVI